MDLKVEDVQNLVSMQLGMHNISLEDRFIEDLDAESADLINLIAAAEDKFNITFDEEEIAGVSTVQELYNLIKKLF